MKSSLKQSALHPLFYTIVSTFRDSAHGYQKNAPPPERALGKKANTPKELETPAEYQKKNRSVHDSPDDV